jgi:tetratricopeptide (TPR) repeat protein
MITPSPLRSILFNMWRVSHMCQRSHKPQLNLLSSSAMRVGPPLLLSLSLLYACGGPPKPPGPDEFSRPNSQQNTTTPSGDGQPAPKPKIKKAAKQTFLEAGQLANLPSPDYARAISLYEEAYQEDSNLKIALYNIAYLYERQENMEKAIEWYRRAATEGVGDGWVNIGLMQLDAGNQGEAEASFRRALELEPLNGRAHLNIALISNDRKDFKESISSVRNALKEDATNADAYAVLSQVYYDLGRYKLALLVVDAGLSLNDEHSGLLTTMGLIYLKLEDVIKAIRAFDKAIQMDKSNFAARLNLGLITFNFRDYERSYQLLGEATALKPEHVDALLARSVAARALKKFDEAKRGYEKVLVLKPNHPGAIFNLAVLQQDYVEIEGFEARAENIKMVITQYEKVLNFTQDKALRKKVAQRIEDARLILESIEAEKEMAAEEAKAKEQESATPPPADAGSAPAQ